ncbi:putative OsmC-like protein [Cryobacterium sp. MP_M5]|uniref:OsmC family protein n=1 Tax=unclassified Cryobacterium TaxID=2649013 RepID=UPI0018C986A6|nr:MULTISPECIES: OsmC family protein [unclassified Cryobacterium]MBG6058962.1 putative OsmC-like protein [Cryobacterium sp. MP_M3]MEC5177029.1 putative OsmC-like protein [Cryobacterium sp. MP_M5]
MSVKPLKVTVTGTSESPTKLAVSVRDFSFIIDEPAAYGGEDAGPNPVEYALASLAGCMNVVIHMVAKEQGVEVRSLRLTVKGELDPSRLMALPTENRAGFQSIELRAEFDSDSSTAELAEVLRLSGLRCPVSDNLGNTTPVTLRLAAPAELEEVLAAV